MTHLTPNLVAVQVPEEAQDAYIDYGFLIYNLGEDPPYEYTEPLVGNYRFLGLCTSSGPEFDAEAYVQLFAITRLSQYGWKDYVLSKEGFDSFTCGTAKESFLTLMQSAGCWFENPLGNDPDEILKYSPEKYLEWTAAQSQSSPKWAILEKL
mgnify:CR=1 FL=1